MDDDTGYACPHCGEWVETIIDASAGRRQEYVEDCPVCCRPIVVKVVIDRHGGARIDVQPE